MEEKNISEKEGLEIISRMIRQTQNRTPAASGNTFIAWGLIMAVTATIVSIDCNYLHLGFCSWGYVLIPVLGLTYTIIARLLKKKRGDAYVKTYVGDMISIIWRCAFIVMALVPFEAIAHEGQTNDILFLEMFIPAFASFITTNMLKVKGSTICNTLAIVISLKYLLSTGDANNPNMSFAIASICSMVIPGILINRKAKKDNELNDAQ